MYFRKGFSRKEVVRNSNQLPYDSMSSTASPCFFKWLPIHLKFVVNGRFMSRDILAYILELNYLKPKLVKIKLECYSAR